MASHLFKRRPAVSSWFFSFIRENYLLTDGLPPEYVVDALRRASTSESLRAVEGSGRGTGKSDAEIEPAGS
jgi:hypothetical protein